MKMFRGTFSYLCGRLGYVASDGPIRRGGWVDRSLLAT
jgi:hypothetical protein